MTGQANPSLAGRNALVSGGSRGIGKAIAAALLAAGANVHIISRKFEAVDAAVAELNAEAPKGSGTASGSACNIGQGEDITALFERLDAADITIDLLVANAATNPYFGPMVHVEDAAWDKTFDVNVKGSFRLARAVGLRLIAKEQPGTVLFVSSILGMGAAPLQGVYGMTKAALISLTATLAAEWGGGGLRVNCIAPGLVETKFAAALTSNPALRKGFVGRTALARVGQPEDIAGAAVWLSSDASAYVTGQTLAIDGGYTIG